MKYLLFIAVAIAMISFSFKRSAAGGGQPWKGKPQLIPGKVECEFYDLGGEGVAYHDADAVNNGSGKLNPPNGSFLNEFRMKEGVDISYTKGGDIDVTPYNETNRDTGKLYVGWTEPDEWLNYTVDVKLTGSYRTSVIYTANGYGLISLSVDGKILNSFGIKTTHNDLDTVPWRQWHHWNKVELDPGIQLTKGRHVLTLRIIEHGNMNFDYIEFEKNNDAK